jgi:hypothetical protein
MAIRVPNNATHIYSTFLGDQQAAFKKNNIPLTATLSFSLKMRSIGWYRKRQERRKRRREKRKRG